ncbi:MAG: aldo/keto reductase [Chloroflexota bacterium]|nr:MAG: aldo/keto reductase [Chloroflexota bacterium]
MEIRRLGRSGLKVSSVWLGGNTFGWTTDEKASFAVLDAYVEGGGNAVDSADSYSRWAPGNVGGESEIVLGNWLKSRKNRHQVVVATKVATRMGDLPHEAGLSRRWIMEAVEHSLRRLQVDYIDLYQAHRDDPETPLDETMRAFADLIQQGKVRYIGASNYSAWRLTRTIWESDRGGHPRFESIQPKFNIVDRDEYERELEPMIREFEVGVVTYSSLASGFLSGKYQRGGTLPTSKRAGGVERSYFNDRGWRILDAVQAVAGRLNATPSQVALAWIIQRPGMTAPIASATTPEQAREILGAATLRLDVEAVASLDSASAWK